MAIEVNATTFRRPKKISDAAGMLADLVELDRNPLKVKPDEIKDIQVPRTLKRGKTAYAKPS